MIKKLTIIVLFATLLFAVLWWVATPHVGDYNKPLPPTPSVSTQPAGPTQSNVQENTTASNPVANQDTLRQATLAQRLTPDAWGDSSTPVGDLDESFVKAANAAESDWMDSQGFPNDLRLKKWNRAEIEKAAAAGDVKAMNMLSHLKLENGEPDWDRSEAFLKYGSAYYARLRAAYELGFVGPGSGHSTTGLKQPKPRDIIAGVAWDLVAQKLGDRTILWTFTAHKDSKKLPETMSLMQLSMAYEQADSIIVEYNAARQKLGLPPLREEPNARSFR